MSKFEELYSINVNEHKEDRDGLSYLSWSWAWAEFKKRCPEATYSVWRDEKGKPYLYDENLGYMVFVSVTADGETYDMWLPVMDSKNKAMKNQPYTYLNKYGKELTVQAASMFDINKSIMRCLVKCISMFGLGLYIYAGEDLPNVEEEAKAVYVNTEQIVRIMDFCRDNGINSDGICQLYKVESINRLTDVMYSNIEKHWADIKERLKEKTE